MYSFKCREKADSKNARIVKTKNRRVIVSSYCLVYYWKKSRFIKEQEASRLLSTLGIKTLISKNPLFGGILF